MQGCSRPMQHSRVLLRHSTLAAGPRLGVQPESVPHYSLVQSARCAACAAVLLKLASPAQQSVGVPATLCPAPTVTRLGALPDRCVRFLQHRGRKLCLHTLSTRRVRWQEHCGAWRARGRLQAGWCGLWPRATAETGLIRVAPCGTQTCTEAAAMRTRSAASPAAQARPAPGLLTERSWRRARGRSPTSSRTRTRCGLTSFVLTNYNQACGAARWTECSVCSQMSWSLAQPYEALSCISQQVSHAEPADLQSHRGQPVSSAKLAYFPVPPVQGMFDLRAEQSQHAEVLTWPNTARCATAMRAWGLVGG
jgi:hypothetical protein